MRYKLFGEGTGLRVSEIALGTAMFGTAWGYGAEPDEARAIFDVYAEAGGNFIDTADSYQLGQSESIVGDCLEGRRESFVVATKYTMGAEQAAHPLMTGNNRKNMVRSVEASLKRLKTDCIDLYWVHWPDGVTRAEEIVRGLEDLTRAGKILYAGLSNFPAWRVARAATIAELRGWAPIVGLQIEYNLIERAAEGELLPMAQAMGISVTAWSPLAGGVLTGKYRRGEPGRLTRSARDQSDVDLGQTAVLDAVLAVAEECDAGAGAVALAWLLARGAIPIIGPRTTAQAADNLQACGLTLSRTQLAKLDAASANSLGVPSDFQINQRIRLAGGDAAAVEAPVRPPA